MKKFSLSILGLILSANMATADKLDALLIASTSADLITTEMALRRPGLYEANPLMQSPYARIGLKTLSTTLIIKTRHKLIKEGHKKTANILTGIACGFFTILAINNYKKMR